MNTAEATRYLTLALRQGPNPDRVLLELEVQGASGSPLYVDGVWVRNTKHAGWRKRTVTRFLNILRALYPEGAHYIVTFRD